MAKEEKAQAQANSPEIPDWYKKGEGERVQTQFPPFWKAKEGAKFYGKLVDQDDTDPEFERWIFVALAPVQCHRGPVSAGEDVVVKKGELFTVSKAATLRIGNRMGCDMVVVCTGKIEANTPAGFVWGFDATISPESAKMLNERRAALAKTG